MRLSLLMAAIVLVVGGCASDVQVRTTSMKASEPDATYVPVMGGGGKSGPSSMDKTMHEAETQRRASGETMRQAGQYLPR